MSVKNRLDLSAIQKPELEMTLPNGETLRLLPPPKVLVERLQSVEQSENINDIYSLVTEILANNAEGLDFDIDVNNLDLYFVSLILQEYSKFIVDIQQDPNSKSPTIRKTVGDNISVGPGRKNG